LTEPKKHTLKLDYSTYTSDFRNNEGTNLSVYTNATSLYGEYGITDRLTAIGYIPFFKQNSYKITK
jgi:hypothetical protein